MHYPLCLLTAAWLTGAPVDNLPDPNSPPAAPAVQPGSRPDVPEKSAAVPLSFRERMRKLFGGKTDDTPKKPDPAMTPVAMPAAMAPPMPGPMNLPPGRPGMMPMPTAVPPLPLNVQLSPRDLEKLGHEQDYSWITGKIFQMPGNGHWMIRYAGPYEVDQFGGGMVLVSTHELTSLRDGDIVCVHGKVAGGGYGAAAVYQVNELNLIEHGTP